ncbi:MAG: hypothetical protein ACJA00_001398 [Myxococcota bacterium]|jgi:hypothetical protein
MPGKEVREPQVAAPSKDPASSAFDLGVDMASAAGNAFMQFTTGLTGTDHANSGATAVVEPASAADAGGSAAPRVVAGSGGFVYEQHADGLVRIVEGPSGAGHTFPVESPINEAITAEIGPYPNVGECEVWPEPPTGTRSAAVEVNRIFGNILGTLANGANTVRDATVDPVGTAVDTAQAAKDGVFGAVKGAADRAWDWWAGEEEEEQASPDLGESELDPVLDDVGQERPIPEGNHQDRGTFVGAAVEETGVTSEILGTIYRYFPLEDRVVGGFLDNSQQGWKVNFHWEYMRDMIDEAMGQGADAELQVVRDALDAVPPSGSGYRNDANAGDTADTSTTEQLLERWRTVNAQKRVLTPIFDRITPWTSSRYSDKDFYLATARIAEPGTSKHGTGKALDIRGDNSRISTISSSLGATTTYDEASHVHVEFLSGVTEPTGEGE